MSHFGYLLSYQRPFASFPVVFLYQKALLGTFLYVSWVYNPREALTCVLLDTIKKKMMCMCVCVCLCVHVCLCACVSPVYIGAHVPEKLLFQSWAYLSVALSTDPLVNHRWNTRESIHCWLLNGIHLSNRNTNADRTRAF